MQLDFYFGIKTKRLECGCRRWLGARSRGGQKPDANWYGSFNTGRDVAGVVRAHVWAAWRAGLIPDLRVPEGFQLDHRCEDTLCVEALCFELVTGGENTSRMWESRRSRACDGIPF